MITTEQLIKKYGKPTEQGTGYLIPISLPYPMKLAWDLNTKVTTIRCHRLVADKLKEVFNELLLVYGLPKIQELGLNIYGGCFNFRKMRGGNDYSRHSWGVAIDLHPEKNTLKMTYKQALFSKPEYAKMHEIFEKNGFENLGKVKGYDAMHWQIKE